MGSYDLDEIDKLKTTKSVPWADNPITIRKKPPKEQDSPSLPDKISGVYFFGAESRNDEENDDRKKLIKIGYSDDLKDRLRHLRRVVDPRNFVVVEGIIEDEGKDLEEKLHDKFEDYRIAWEWFESSEEIDDYIEENSNNELAQNLSWYLWNLTNKEMERWE